MHANSRLELRILIDSGSDLKFKTIFRFGCLFGQAFCTIELILLFLNVSLKFLVWLLLCDHGYDWVCLIEMGMAKLDWVLLKFCNFSSQCCCFFFFKNFDILNFFFSLVD
jgi:hypothetical protein